MVEHLADKMAAPWVLLLVDDLVGYWAGKKADRRAVWKDYQSVAPLDARTAAGTAALKAVSKVEWKAVQTAVLLDEKTAAQRVALKVVPRAATLG